MNFDANFVANAEPHKQTTWIGRRAFLLQSGFVWNDRFDKFVRGKFEVHAEFVLFESSDAWNEMLKQMHRGAAEFDLKQVMKT